MNSLVPVAIGSDRPVEELLARIAEDMKGWQMDRHVRPWFRGQADAGQPPRPSVFRGDYDEFWLMTQFRLNAVSFPQAPETQRIDQWLFLAQHYGLPTRLLDWTESPLTACFFAFEKWITSERVEENYTSADMAIWMIHPIELNRLTDSEIDGFLNTWTQGNKANENCRMAFHSSREKPQMAEAGLLQPSDYPLAVLPSNVDARIAMQRSCFMVYGTKEEDLEAMLAGTVMIPRYFRKYTVPRQNAPAMHRELETMGVSFSNVYPDLAGIATELRLRLGPPPAHKFCGRCEERRSKP